MQWPHSPVHQLNEAGTFMITGGTLDKAHLFHDEEKLNALQTTLFALAAKYNWQLQAWALFSNHYHFVVVAGEEPQPLKRFLQHLHSQTAIDLNKMAGCPGRTVWFQFWDTRLTYQKSYLARLQYTHCNAARHGLVKRPQDYPWCSAGWLERTTSPVFQRTLSSFSAERLSVPDEFDPVFW